MIGIVRARSPVAVAVRIGDNVCAGCGSIDVFSDGKLAVFVIGDGNDGAVIGAFNGYGYFAFDHAATAV